jgi:N-acetylglucosamine-6-phosphate deacetylase
MATAVRNCVRLLNVPLTKALRFASTNPAQFLGADDRLGRLALGYRADLVTLDSVKIEALHTWVAASPLRSVVVMYLRSSRHNLARSRPERA